MLLPPSLAEHVGLAGGVGRLAQRWSRLHLLPGPHRTWVLLLALWSLPAHTPLDRPTPNARLGLDARISNFAIPWVKHEQASCKSPLHCGPQTHPLSPPGIQLQGDSWGATPHSPLTWPSLPTVPPTASVRFLVSYWETEQLLCHHIFSPLQECIGFMLSQAPQSLCPVSEAKLGRTHKKKSVRLLNSKTLAPKTVLDVKAKNATI